MFKIKISFELPNKCLYIETKTNNIHIFSLVFLLFCYLYEIYYISHILLFSHILSSLFLSSHLFLPTKHTHIVFPDYFIYSHNNCHIYKQYCPKWL